MSSPIPVRPLTDELPLEIECLYSNIGEEWIASAWHDGVERFAAKGRTRPEALRNLADDLDEGRLLK